MGRIYLIGGGEIEKNETAVIDKEFIAESGGKNSRLLFFPTAAFDSEDYISAFERYFSALGCANIKIARISIEPAEGIIDKIRWASGIYLGGGSTSELIRALGAPDILSSLVEGIGSGKVLAGMSAGAMCLGDIAVLSEREEDLLIGKGLGITPKLIPVAHYFPEDKDMLLDLKFSYPDSRVMGIPEGAAFIIEDGKEYHVNGVFEIKNGTAEAIP